MKNLHLLLDRLDIHQNEQIILAGDFNIFLDTTLEAEGASPCLKNKRAEKLIKAKEHFELCDIWRLRNPDAKQFTFRQRHASGFLQRRLDFFISNSLQDVITHADFFVALSTNHFLVIISISRKKNSHSWSHFLEIQQYFSFRPKLCYKNKKSYSNLPQ